MEWPDFLLQDHFDSPHARYGVVGTVRNCSVLFCELYYPGRRRKKCSVAWCVKFPEPPCYARYTSFRIVYICSPMAGVWTCVACGSGQLRRPVGKEITRTRFTIYHDPSRLLHTLHTHRYYLPRYLGGPAGALSQPGPRSNLGYTTLL